jgi:hypothetical protein
MLSSALPVAAQDELKIYDPLRVSIRPISFNPLTESPIVPGTAGWVTDVGSDLANADYFVMNLGSNAIPATFTEDLAALDATIVAIYPPRSYAVRMPAGNRDAVDALPPVRWIQPYLAGYKVPPYVAEAAAAASGKLDVKLGFFEGEDPNGYVANIAALVDGIDIGEIREPNPDGSRSNGMIAVSIPQAELVDALRNLARLEALETMELWLPDEPANDDKLTWLQIGDFVPSDANANPPVIADLDVYAPAFIAGIDGRGETVAVADSGVRPDSCFFRWDASSVQGTRLDPPGLDPSTVHPAKKIVAYYWHHGDQNYDEVLGGGCGNWNGHGTHVAGAAVGDNIAFLAKDDDLMADQGSNVPFRKNIDHHQAGDGMAPGAQLLVQDLLNQTTCDATATVPEIFEQAYFSTDPTGAIQVRHHSNSWGTPAPAGGHPYTQRAMDSDEFTWTHRDFNLFYLAGNEGNSANNIRDPSLMKNCLTVGNTGNPNAEPGRWAMSASSSHGPAVGSRIKPDLSAPGSNTASASYAGACGLAIKGGTSMSTPSIAGMSALLRQYIREGRYPDGIPDAARGFSPTSALIKALLVNSTRDVWDGVAGHGAYTGDQGSAAGNRPSVGQGWGHPVLDDIIDFGPTDVMPNPDPPAPVPPETKRERSNLLILTDSPNGLLTTSANDNRAEALPTLHGAIEPQQIHEYFFTVTTDRTEAVHVTLAWADFPASLNAAVPLVNDLDLEVIDPTGKVWRPEPGIPGLSTPTRLWDNGFSRVTALTNPQAGPPFTNFEGRDERNNLENIFIKQADAIIGTWRARVIYFATAQASGRLERVFPDLETEAPACTLTVGGVPGIVVPCDRVRSDDQGYALVVSGPVADVPILGTPVVHDGCLQSPGNGQLDKNEMVNLHVPLTAPEDMQNVIGCLTCLGLTCGNVQIGGFAPDIPVGLATNCSVFGDMAAGQTAVARFAILLRPTHPDMAAQFRLDVSSSTPGAQPPPPIPCHGVAVNASYQLSVPHTTATLIGAGTQPPNQPGKGACAGMPLGSPLDPKYTFLDGDADTVADDLFLEFCPGNPIASTLKFNIYRGRSGPCQGVGEWDHVPILCYADPNDDGCNDDGFAVPESTLNGRCEALLLNQLPYLAAVGTYYTISAERACSNPGHGAEGAFRVCATCAEIPYGGACP